MSWREGPRLPVGSAGGAWGMTDGRLVLAGGTAWMNGHRQCLDRVDSYDRGRWTPGPPLPCPTAYAPFVASATRLRILAGWTYAGSVWRTGVVAPERRLLGSAIEHGERIYLFGGCARADRLEGMTDVVSCFDEMHWQPAGTIPGGPLALAGSAKCGDEAYLFGQSQTLAFHFATGHWRTIRPLPLPARGVSAARFDERHILLAGGYAGEFLTEVRLYDTLSDRYEAAPPLPVGLMIPALGVSDGTVLIAGGEDGFRSRSSRLFIGTLG